MKNDILKKKAQQMQSKFVDKKKRDSAFLQDATRHIKELENATLQGNEFMSNAFLTAYQLHISTPKGEAKSYIAFVWPRTTAQVVDFLVRAAKTDTINGIVGNTENVLICKEYKLKGGM